MPPRSELWTFPVVVVIAAAAAFMCSDARAQSTPADIVSTPDAALATWRAQIVAESALVAAVGLADCLATPTTEAELVGVVTLPTPAGGVIVGGTVEYSLTDGDRCYHAYAVGVNGLLSGVSPNARRVILRPVPVVFVE